MGIEIIKEEVSFVSFLPITTSDVFSRLPLAQRGPTLALTTLRPQTTNWLKWEVLNETVGAELRIAAFRSLHACNSNEAEDAAILITKRDSDTQGMTLEIVN